MQRVAIVGLWQETNTYSSRPTSIEDFEDFELLSGGEVLEHHRGTGSVIGGFVDALTSRNHEPLGIFSAGAWPGGAPDAETARELLRRLDAELAAAPDVDAVLVNLHGAMVAEGFDDMEAEALKRVRARFGARPLVAVMDLHANPSPTAVGLCDGLVGYRTYPHVDMHECGAEAAELLEYAFAGQRLITAYGRLPELTSPVAQSTADHPMRDLLQRAEARAREYGVLRISLYPGFPYSDVDRVGFSVTAVTLRERTASARSATRLTLEDVESHLGDFAKSLPSPADAVTQARASTCRPVVLADVADNIGGGGPGDGTAILAELIRQRVDGAVALLVDPAAVERAAGAGPGAEVEFELGGHSDDLHGFPVPVRARVERLGDGTYRAAGSYMTGQTFSMGRTAVLEADGVRIVTMSKATPPFHLEQLTTNGIEPRDASVIVVKGAVAWRDPYSKVMGSFLEVDTPGCCPADPYRLQRARQIAPRLLLSG